jgi:hypothetical protein
MPWTRRSSAAVPQSSDAVARLTAMFGPERNDGRITIAVSGSVGVVVVGGTAIAATQTSSFAPVLAFGAAVLAFTGALIGAWIAASSAGRRQHADLEAAADRHAATLAAESLRLGQQLRHDREIFETRQLETLLDEVAARYEAAFVSFVKLRVMSGSDPAMPQDAYRVALNDASRVLIPLMEMVRRLQLRFRGNVALVESINAVYHEFAAVFSVLQSREDRSQIKGQIAEAERHLDEARRQFATFCEESRRYLGPAVAD